MGPQAYQDDNPPAYEPPAYSAPSRNPLNPEIPLAHQPQAVAGPSSSVTRQFPPEFNLYYSSLMGKSCNLGEHQDQPIYALTTHTGWSGNPDVVLHTTTDKKSPPLATAKFRTFSNDTMIVLPPPPRGGTSRDGELVLHGSTFLRTFSFSFDVPGPDSQLRAEPFEWRHSKGQDVGQLASVWGTGWKLVRLAGQGKEIVAVCTMGPASLSKTFCFKFLGAGETGALGERWAVMAVISGISIWERDRRAKNKAAGSMS